MTEWEKLAGQFWPDIACPALRGQYLVGCDWDAPLVYRRRRPDDREYPAHTLGHSTLLFACRVAFENNPTQGRQGRQLLGRELAIALAGVAENLNDATWDETKARREIAYLGQATWPMPPTPEKPYYTERKQNRLYLCRDYPFFRCRFDDSWTATPKAEPVVIFKRKLAPAVLDLVFLLNAGLLTEGQARPLIEGRVSLSVATGVLTSAVTTTA